MDFAFLIILTSVIGFDWTILGSVHIACDAQGNFAAYLLIYIQPSGLNLSLEASIFAVQDGGDWSKPTHTPKIYRRRTRFPDKHFDYVYFNEK